MNRNLVAVGVGILIEVAPNVATATCSPDAANRPVCPSSARDEDATFIDPTAVIDDADKVHLGSRSYVAPFARIDATQGVFVGEEANIQDSVELLTRRGPITVGDRVILAHGARVVGPSVLGSDDARPLEHAPSFVGFNSVVEGAVVERDAMVLHLARVGPGITIREGRVVLSGKSIDTQSDAEDFERGKVVPITEALRLFMDEVVHVNTSFARAYTRLYRDDATNVTGINFDPGHTDFDPLRDLPTLDGYSVRDPAYRNRIIGDARFDDSLASLERRRRMGSAVSIRADEGQPFWIHRIARVDDHATFHALEHTSIWTGEDVSFGQRAIIHGGDSAATEDVPTTIGGESRIGDHAVVFRSVLGRRVEVGCGSVVDGSTLPPRTHVPPRTVVFNVGHDDEAVYPVEWNPGCDD